LEQAPELERKVQPVQVQAELALEEPRALEEPLAQLVELDPIQCLLQNQNLGQPE
jgi:hypothetical protein